MENDQKAPSVSQSQPNARRSTNPFLLLTLAIVAAGAIAWAMYEREVRASLERNLDLNADLIYRTLGLTEGQAFKLDPRYSDADGDLVADPPTDPKQFIDPPKLAFSFVATEDPQRYKGAFADLVAHLSTVTGKPVEYAVFNDTEEELKAMRDGNLQIAGLSTGVVPAAVNASGFVPFCRMATADGVSAYRMQIIVPADSAISTLSDLKGHELTLTEPGSNSGFKAPLVLLKDKDLRVGRDFHVRYSGGHEESIAGIADKRFEAAAVADEVLSRDLAAGKIKKEQYRSIYQSDEFPTAAFGVVYNLKPEVAAKVKDALFSFQWKGTSLEKEYAASSLSKFLPVNYKNDWAVVRRIDDAIRSELAALRTAPQPAATTQGG